MKTRREFLTLTIAGCASLALASQKLNAFAKQPVGLQLYTLRQQAEADLPKTLAAIKAAGYDEIELYGSIYTRPAVQLRQMVEDHGLKAPSGHFNYDDVESKFDYARDLGLEYMICPMLPKDMWNSADGFKRAGETFNKWGEKAKKRGLKFGFHNHNYEFQKFDRQNGLDILMANSDPKLVVLEMDCYWVTQAGGDPFELMQRFPNRIRMLHLKDRKSGFANSTELNESAEHFAEFGTGSIDWKPIIAKAKSIGVKHYFVEQDTIEGDPIQSIKISEQNARKILA